MRESTKRVAAAAFPLALSACTAGPPDVEAFAQDWVSKAASEHQLRFFRGSVCSSIALAEGKVDVVRTSTPTWFRTRTALGHLDEVTSDDPGALDVRSVDQDGTPLARRCLDVAAGLASARFEVLALAPEGAKWQLEPGEILQVGDHSYGLKIKVTDASGAAVRGVPITRGPTWPLQLTREDGTVEVSTPTTAPDRVTVLHVDAYGIPGPFQTRNAVRAEPAECPERRAELPLPGEPASGDLQVLPTRGPLVVVRPRPSVEGSGSAIDLYEPRAGTFRFERIATATTAASGVAAAVCIPETCDSGATIAVADQAVVEVWTLTSTGTRRTSIEHRASIDSLAIVGRQIIAAADGSLFRDGVEDPTFRDVRSVHRVPFDERDVLVATTGSGAIIDGSERIEILDVVGTPWSASLDERWSSQDTLLFTDPLRDRVYVRDPRGEIAQFSLRSASSLATTGLGRDGFSDVVVESNETWAVFAGNGASRLVRTATCTFEEATHVTNMDVNRDGTPEILASEPGSWRISIFEGP